MPGFVYRPPCEIVPASAVHVTSLAETPAVTTCNWSDCNSVRLARAGETASELWIETLAVPLTVGSDCRTAVTFTLTGDGVAAGAT
jgi:hypothetical protein